MRIHVIKRAEGKREIMIVPRRGLGLPTSLVRGDDRAAVLADTHARIEALALQEGTRTVPRRPE